MGLLYLYFYCTATIPTSVRTPDTPAPILVTVPTELSLLFSKECKARKPRILEGIKNATNISAVFDFPKVLGYNFFSIRLKN